MKRLSMYLTVLLAVIFIGPVSHPAQASTISFFLNKSNPQLPAANYVKVTISDSTVVQGDIDFQVDVLTDAFPDRGDNFGMDNFFFNYDNGFNVGIDNIVNVDPSTWMVKKDVNAGAAFGIFDIQAKGLGSSRSVLLTFSINGVNGDEPWTYAVGNPASQGGTEFFAAHIGGFSFPSPLTEVTSAKFAGSTYVPIPTTLLLLGSFLALRGGCVWMRKKDA